MTLRAMTLWSCCGNLIWRWHLLLWTGTRSAVGFFPKCTSVSIHEQNFKFFHRTFYTPVRLQRMFPNTSNLCSKCNVHKGTFCFGPVTFWKGVHSVIQEVIGNQFLLTSSFYLLNNAPANFLDTDTKHWMIILLFLAKKCILLRWSTPQVPAVDMWISQISTLIPLENLTYDPNHRLGRFRRIWEPLHSFLHRLWPFAYPWKTRTVCLFIYFISCMCSSLICLLCFFVFCFVIYVLHSAFCCLGVGFLSFLCCLSCFVLFEYMSS